MDDSLPPCRVVGPERTTHVDVLLAVVAPPNLLRVFTRGKVGDVPAPRLWSGPILIGPGEKLHDAIGLADARTALPEGMSEYDPADHQRASERPLSSPLLFSVSFRNH